MSDPTNPYPSSPSPEQPAYGQQAPQGQPAYGQQAYGQQAYGQPMYALNPAVEKIRSNASTARMLSFLSFLFGGMFLSGGMWFWANKLMEEAQAYGAPMDVVTDVQGARSAAKICTASSLPCSSFSSSSFRSLSPSPKRVPARSPEQTASVRPGEHHAPRASLPLVRTIRSFLYPDSVAASGFASRGRGTRALRWAGRLAHG